MNFKTSNMKLKLLLAAAGLVLMAGCTRIPLDALWALRQFDFETFEPALLKLAVRMPPGLDFAARSLPVTVRVTREGAQPVEQTFVLHETADAAERAGLPPLDAREARWVVLRFDAAESRRVRAWRDTLLAHKAAARQSGSEGRNRLEVGAAARLCRTGAPVKGHERLAAALHWSHEKGFVPVLRESEVDALLREGPQPKPLAQLESC